MSWQLLAGAACGFLIAAVTTPAGVSGAVLLLPVQVSVLGVPSPVVTPTNLLFNILAVPGGLLRFWHERRLVNPLSALLLAGTLPGVIAGACIRVELLAGGRSFMFVASGVLLPLGLWSLVFELPRGTSILVLLLLPICALEDIEGVYGHHSWITKIRIFCWQPKSSARNGESVLQDWSIFIVMEGVRRKQIIKTRSPRCSPL